MVTYVRTVNVVNSAGTPALNVTMTGTPAGRLLVATWQCYWNTAGAANLSNITGGGTWTFPSTGNQQNPPSAFGPVTPSPWVALCGIAWVITTTANPVVTLTFNRGTPTSRWWRVNEFTDVQPGTVMRAAASMTLGGAGVSLSNVITPAVAAQAGDACLAVTAGATGATSVALPWNRPNQSGTGNVAVIDQAYLVPAESGHVSATFTGTSQGWPGACTCAVGPPVGSAPRLWPGNMLTLPEQSFEGGQGGWAASFGTNTTAVARTQARASDGTWSLSWQVSAAGASGVESRQFPATTGQQIGFEFDLFYDGAGTPNAQLLLNWFGGINGAWRTDTNFTNLGTLTPGGWRRYTATVTVPAHAQGIGALIAHIRASSGAAGATVNLDRVIIGPQPPAGRRPAIPRGFTGGQWRTARIWDGTRWR